MKNFTNTFPDLSDARVIILHRPHESNEAIIRQLRAIGVTYFEAWPTLPPNAVSADFIFFDSDLGYDSQFPWEQGAAPMPLIALVGSESPSRIGWALRQGCDAHMIKPVRDNGVYSTLLIASHTYRVRMNNKK